jgi:hypothetical protein
MQTIISVYSLFRSPLIRKIILGLLPLFDIRNYIHPDFGQHRTLLEQALSFAGNRNHRKMAQNSSIFCKSA